MALRCICVAWDDTAPASWALEFGTLARALGAAADHVIATELPRACRLHRPLLVVIGRERAHALRRRLDRSPADALVEALDCRVVVAASP